MLPLSGSRTKVWPLAGSLVATYGGQAMGLYRAGEPAGFVGSVIGAIVLLLIYRLLRRRTA